jgi:hypothetical protein
LSLGKPLLLRSGIEYYFLNPDCTSPHICGL